MNLHTDGYESVVHDFAVTKIGFIAFASLPNFMGERLQVTMASLQVGFGGLDVGESVHDRLSVVRKQRSGRFVATALGAEGNWGQNPIFGLAGGKGRYSWME